MLKLNSRSRRYNLLFFIKIVFNNSNFFLYYFFSLHYNDPISVVNIWKFVLWYFRLSGSNPSIIQTSNCNCLFSAHFSWKHMETLQQLLQIPLNNSQETFEVVLTIFKQTSELHTLQNSCNIVVNILKVITTRRLILSNISTLRNNLISRITQ